MYFKFFFKNLILLSFLSNILALEKPCTNFQSSQRKIQNMVRSISDMVKELEEKLNVTKIRGLNADSADIVLDLPMMDTRGDLLPEECQKGDLPKDCAEATACTHRSGIYKIQVPNYNELFYIECDVKTDGGDWIVIQRRQDGSVDFNRPWADYQTGFGVTAGEFFIGLDKLHALTNNNGPQELIIVMEKSYLSTAFAKYDEFAIGNAADLYKLKKLGRYSGTAGDSLRDLVGFSFMTTDHDNETEGAWWQSSSGLSNLNGQYGSYEFGKGVSWKTFSNYTLRYEKMMIRRRL